MGLLGRVLGPGRPFKDGDADLVSVVDPKARTNGRVKPALPTNWGREQRSQQLRLPRLRSNSKCLDGRRTTPFRR